MPPSAKTDCWTPSSFSTAAPSRRPSANTIRQPPKKAINTRPSTAGRRATPLIKRNSSAGIAIAKTKRVSASPYGLRHQREAASR
jgi:hypothetical protein